MTLKKGLIIGQAPLPSILNEPDKVVCAGGLSLEELMALKEMTVQREPTEGSVKTSVDMTRSQFNQLEKVS